MAYAPLQPLQLVNEDPSKTRCAAFNVIPMYEVLPTTLGALTRCFLPAPAMAAPLRRKKEASGSRRASFRGFHLLEEENSSPITVHDDRRVAGDARSAAVLDTLSSTSLVWIRPITMSGFPF